MKRRNFLLFVCSLILAVFTVTGCDKKSDNGEMQLLLLLMGDMTSGNCVNTYYYSDGTNAGYLSMASALPKAACKDNSTYFVGAANADAAAAMANGYLQQVSNELGRIAALSGGEPDCANTETAVDADIAAQTGSSLTPTAQCVMLNSVASKQVIYCDTNAQKAEFQNMTRITLISDAARSTAFNTHFTNLLYDRVNGYGFSAAVLNNAVAMDTAYTKAKHDSLAGWALNAAVSNGDTDCRDWIGANNAQLKFQLARSLGLNGANYGIDQDYVDANVTSPVLFGSYFAGMMEALLCCRDAGGAGCGNIGGTDYNVDDGGLGLTPQCGYDENLPAPWR